MLNAVFWACPLPWGLSSVAFVVYYFKVDWVHSFDKKGVQ